MKIELIFNLSVLLLLLLANKTNVYGDDTTTSEDDHTLKAETLSTDGGGSGGGGGGDGEDHTLKAEQPTTGSSSSSGGGDSEDQTLKAELTTSGDSEDHTLKAEQPTTSGGGDSEDQTLKAELSTTTEADGEDHTLKAAAPAAPAAASDDGDSPAVDMSDDGKCECCDGPGVKCGWHLANCAGGGGGSKSCKPRSLYYCEWQRKYGILYEPCDQNCVHIPVSGSNGTDSGHHHHNNRDDFCSVMFDQSFIYIKTKRFEEVEKSLKGALNEARLKAEQAMNKVGKAIQDAPTDMPDYLTLPTMPNFGLGGQGPTTEKPKSG